MTPILWRNPPATTGQHINNEREIIGKSATTVIPHTNYTLFMSANIQHNVLTIVAKIHDENDENATLFNVSFSIANEQNDADIDNIISIITNPEIHDYTREVKLLTDRSFTYEKNASRIYNQPHIIETRRLLITIKKNEDPIFFIALNETPAALIDAMR